MRLPLEWSTSCPAADRAVPIDLAAGEAIQGDVLTSKSWAQAPRPRQIHASRVSITVTDAEEQRIGVPQYHQKQGCKAGDGSSRHG
jgi:hypothetical protein